MREFPCWCWKEDNTTRADVCGFCGWPKSHHHDNRRGRENGSQEVGS
jgi:hypothetical protein